MRGGKTCPIPNRKTQTLLTSTVSPSSALFQCIRAAHEWAKFHQEKDQKSDLALELLRDTRHAVGVIYALKGDRNPIESERHLVELMNTTVADAIIPGLEEVGDLPDTRFTLLQAVDLAGKLEITSFAESLLDQAISRIDARRPEGPMNDPGQGGREHRPTGCAGNRADSRRIAGNLARDEGEEESRQRPKRGAKMSKGNRDDLEGTDVLRHLTPRGVLTVLEELVRVGRDYAAARKDPIALLQVAQSNIGEALEHLEKGDDKRLPQLLLTTAIASVADANAILALSTAEPDQDTN